MVLTRTAKSCGSDAAIVGVKSAIGSAGDGVKKRGHRGEREVSRKTIARGMPGRSGVTVVTNSYAFFSACEAAGALGTRHSLRPLFSERRTFLQNLGRVAPREYGAVPSLRGAKRRSNPLLLRGNMDCFACARNDALRTRYTHAAVAGGGGDDPSSPPRAALRSTAASRRRRPSARRRRSLARIRSPTDRARPHPNRSRRLRRPHPCRGRAPSR